MSDKVPPSIDRIAGQLSDLELPRALIVRYARAAAASSRNLNEAQDTLSFAWKVATTVAASRQRNLINATGVLVHTNLGRAPLSSQASHDAALSATSYTNLEFNTSSGSRGRRGSYMLELVRELTGGQDAMVVNNNAAALFLTLAVLARDGATVVSRGELIEIGGSYRLPDLMDASGTRMVEVGTTNRTRVEDYRRAVAEDTKLLLKVHKSNYEITGFTEEASLPELVTLSAESGVPFVFDAGSGLLDATTPWLSKHPPPWLAGEPGIRQSLQAGVDLVMFSGDKLLGGPQAGIIVGRTELIQRLRESPIARALRVDGPTLAALAATLEAYAERRVSEIPIWRMASVSHGELAARARKVLEEAGVEGRIVEGVSPAGGGSVPGKGIPSPLIELGGSSDSVFASLLAHRPPLVARRVGGRVVLDLRTVEPDDDSVVVEAIAEACQS